MGNLSRHFDRAEFACRCGCGYGQPHPRLVNLLEELRESIGGKPLRIVSGLRCPPHNSAVNGARRSRHQSGEAADIPSGLVTVRQARNVGFKGIGTKGQWVVHVDVRVSREAVHWQY